MKYTFGGKIVVEPVRLQRLENERNAEKSFSFSHHINPMRAMDDVMSIHAEVYSPKGMNDEQQQAFERAMNRTLRHFRHYIIEEFDAIEGAREPK